MNEDSLNKIKKNSTLVLIPYWSKQWKPAFDFMFGESILLDKKTDETQIPKFNELCNSRGLKNLILVDYDISYRDILPYISPKTTINWIFTHPAATLTDGIVMNALRTILEFYDRDLVNVIGSFDKTLYFSLKKAGYRIKYILPDVKFNDENLFEKGNLAIISDDTNPYHSYYNMLSALKLVHYKKIKLGKMVERTKEFISNFDINVEEVKSFDKLISHNEINLYVNFSDTLYCNVLRSLDHGIPCLLGNTDIFDDYPYLKEQLVLKSDDDVNEIFSKINSIKQNKDKIIETYKNFRKKYIKDSLNSINDFLK